MDLAVAEWKTQTTSLLPIPKAGNPRRGLNCPLAWWQRCHYIIFGKRAPFAIPFLGFSVHALDSLLMYTFRLDEKKGKGEKQIIRVPKRYSQSPGILIWGRENMCLGLKVCLGSV